MNYKKQSAYFLLGLIAFQVILSISLVAAETPTTAGVGKAITEPDFVVWIAKFMGFINKEGNVTWAVIVASIAVLAMIFAATYEILAFTAFEKTWVKGIIAGSIALVIAVSDGITYLTASIMSLAGGSVAIGTTISIIMAVVFFVISSFFRGIAKKRKYMKEAQDAKGAFQLANITKQADIRDARMAAREANNKAPKI